MTPLILSKVGFSLPDRTLFQNLDMVLGEGRQALVGHNGVGKTTLARIIAREIVPDEGRVRGDVHVIIHRQHLDMEDGRSISDRRQNIEEVLGRSSRVRFPWGEWLQQVPARSDDLQLSGGERMRLRLLETLAEAIRIEDDGLDTLIVLDEPTNDLDRSARTFVRDWIRARRNGLLLISHDREILEDVDQIFELSSLGLKSYAGGFQEYQREMQAERARSEKLIRDSERILQDRSREKNEKEDRQAKRSRRGQAQADRGGMPRILIGARKRKAEATTAKIHVEESERVEKASEVLQNAHLLKRLDPFLRMDFAGDARPESQVLVVAENLTLCWPTPLSFQIRAQDRIHIQGANGAGKSSLLKVLMGQGREVGGTLWRSQLLAEKGRVGYLDQAQSNLIAGETVLETVTNESRFSASEARNELAFYGFTKDSVKLKVSDLSGGERLRLALARIFLGEKLPALLVLDEPTNNLDFSSIELLETAIERFPGSILLVTHDEVFRKSLTRFTDFPIS